MDEATCEIVGCGRPKKQRTWRPWCTKHYDRWQRTGRLDLPSVEDRFWAKVDKSGQCWLWTAYTMDNGYGKFSYGGRENAKCVLAHRFSYELVIGPIGGDLQLDHLCRVRNCVRPDHLEPVTPVINNLRSASPTSANAHKTHCVRGHPFDDANTRITADGWRACRQCRAIYRATHPDRRRSKAGS